MTDLYEVLDHPELAAPVLVLALDGWIDAGFGAQTARDVLVEELEPVTVATFDTEALIDYRARRPVMHIVDGVITSLTWPSIELRAASDADGHDLLLLTGAEPDRGWQRFAEAVADLALDLGARLGVGLGAYPAAVPHTRPTRLAVSASAPDLARLGSLRPTLDAPAGVQAVIERRLGAAGVPAVGLWAQVPHYAAAMPYPAAGLALLEGLGEASGLVLPASTLAGRAASMRERLDTLVAANPEHLAMLARMEADVDAEGGDAPGPGAPISDEELPSGDELAAEVERFLRDQD